MSSKKTGYYDIHVENRLFHENMFVGLPEDSAILPKEEDFLSKLPKLLIPEMPIAEACYEYAWKRAYRSLKNGKKVFPKPYIDTCFNGHLFLWDSAFIMQFGKYGERAFPFFGTLDNIYSKQHIDGFICREIDEDEGLERFERYDLSSTGPNVLAWTEWTRYLLTKDATRLQQVYPVILAYHQWLKTNRTWKDGSYFTSGWGSGMDNLPRQIDGSSPEFSHGHLSWVDMTAQQALSCEILVKMAKLLGKDDDSSLEEERELLSTRIQEMWNPELHFFCDLDRFGISTKVMTVGGYWVLLAGLATKDQAQDMVNHLFNPNTFSSKMMVGGLSQSHPLCDDNYWRGGVWAPTTYMVLKGLERYGYHDERRMIAKNYLDNILNDFQETGKLYEVYESKTGHHQNIAREHFVGWTGLAPITVLFEDYLGIRLEATKNEITLYFSDMTPSFCVSNLPFGDGLFSIKYDRNPNTNIVERTHIQSTIHGIAHVHWMEKLFEIYF